MEARVKQYIENECTRDWNQYVGFMRKDENSKDLEKILEFFLEDILPESELKGESPLFKRLSKEEKIQLLDHPQGFLYQYVQGLLHRERNVNVFILKEILQSLKTLHGNIDEKKKECMENMKQIVRFYVKLRASEKILLTGSELSLSFRSKKVVSSKSHPYDLGEIFSRYMMSIVLQKDGIAHNFYEGLYHHVKGTELNEWHPLLKYWMIHFLIILFLFRSSSGKTNSREGNGKSSHSSKDISVIFNTKHIQKWMKAVRVFVQEEKRKNEKKKKDSHSSSRTDTGRRDPRKPSPRPPTREKERHAFLRQRGGDGRKPDPKKKEFSALTSLWKQINKTRSKSSEKKEVKNEFVDIFREMMKNTKIGNLRQSANKVDDTLASVFDNPELKNKVQSHYEELLFQPPYCVMAEEDESSSSTNNTAGNRNRNKRTTSHVIGRCELDKKIPMIFASHNPEADFTMNDLLKGKPGPMEQFRKSGGRLDKETKTSLVNICKEKLNFFKTCYAFDEERFNHIYLPKLKEFQIRLLYLLYTLHQKKYQLYHYLMEAIQGAEVENVNFGENEEEEEPEVKPEIRNTANGNRSQNNEGVTTGNFTNVLSNQNKTLQKVLQKSFKNLSPTKVAKLQIIQQKLEVILEDRKKFKNEEYGSSGYNAKMKQYDDFLRQVYMEVKRILEENQAKV